MLASLPGHPQISCIALLPQGGLAHVMELSSDSDSDDSDAWMANTPKRHRKPGALAFARAVAKASASLNATAAPPALLPPARATSPADAAAAAAPAGRAPKAVTPAAGTSAKDSHHKSRSHKTSKHKAPKMHDVASRKAATSSGKAAVGVPLPDGPLQTKATGATATPASPTSPAKQLKRLHSRKSGHAVKASPAARAKHTSGGSAHGSGRAHGSPMLPKAGGRPSGSSMLPRSPLGQPAWTPGGSPGGKAKVKKQKKHSAGGGAGGSVPGLSGLGASGGKVRCPVHALPVMFARRCAMCCFRLGTQRAHWLLICANDLVRHRCGILAVKQSLHDWRARATLQVSKGHKSSFGASKRKSAEQAAAEFDAWG